jgi:hypothetical protein
MKQTLLLVPQLKHLAPCVKDYLFERKVYETYPKRHIVPFTAAEQLDFILVLKGQLKFTLKNGWSKSRNDEHSFMMNKGMHLCQSDLQIDK